MERTRCYRREPKLKSAYWRVGGKPCYTKEQLDNASEEEFPKMLYRLRAQYRQHRYVRSCLGTMIVSKPIKPIEPNAWKTYHEKRKQEKEKMQKTPSSNEENGVTYSSDIVFDDFDDDDLSDVESLPSPIDVPTGGLNVALHEDKAKSKGSSLDPLAVGTEGNAMVVGPAVNPMNIGAGETLEVKDSLLHVPLNVSAVGGEGNSLFDPLNDENASLEKAEKKMANVKKSKSMALSPAHIPIKKKKKFAALSQNKKLAAIVEKSVKRELACFKNEMLTIFKSLTTKKNKA